MPRNTKRPRLGRGLSSLIRSSIEPDPDLPESTYEPAPPGADAAQEAPAIAPDTAGPSADVPARPDGKAVHTVSLDSIRVNPYQPRRTFDEDALAELTDSIRTHGLLQPILVAERPSEDGCRYDLIAGERRLRAARRAGLSELPCFVRASSPREMLELALIENIHRSDLNPIERAAAYRDLMDRFALTQEQVAGRVGQPRATVANYLRMLDLCDEVQELIVSGRLDFGHGKILASLAGNEDLQVTLARQAAQKGLSVRRLEELVRLGLEAKSGGAVNKGRSTETRAPYVLDIERQLTEAVGTKVAVRPGRGKHQGRITVDYYSLEDFDRIVAMLGATIES